MTYAAESPQDSLSGSGRLILPAMPIRAAGVALAYFAAALAGIELTRGRR